MPRLRNLYTGAAGQAAVMSEFLIRGYNVAVPEVDRGDDLFVVHDADGSLQRIQVKTARAKPRKHGYSAEFLISERQLATPQRPDLYYVLAVRLSDRWEDFVVVTRDRLYTEHAMHSLGSLTRAGLVKLYLSFTAHDVMCSKRSFQAFRNNFSAWPVIEN